MNYFVHSIMYSYYFLMITGQKYLAKLIAQHITTLQILQVRASGRWALRMGTTKQCVCVSVCVSVSASVCVCI